METHPWTHSTDHMGALTPPAVTKEHNATPQSAETAAETPTGLSPETLQVVKLEGHDSSPTDTIHLQHDDHSLGSLTEASRIQMSTPPRVESTSRLMLLSQMSNAIPSPESVVLRRVIDLDVSTLATPTLESPVQRPQLQQHDETTPSSDIPLKPSKLSFSNKNDDTAAKKGVEEPSSPTVQAVDSPMVERAQVSPRAWNKPAQASTPVDDQDGPEPGPIRHKPPGHGPYPMQPVESFASVPFDCMDDVRQGMFPPSPLSEDSFEEEPPPPPKGKALVRTLFGWIEAKSVNPIQAKILSDRDLNIRWDSPVVDNHHEEDSLVEHDAEMGKQSFRPAEDILTASRWFGSGQLEVDPPRIEPVKEYLAQVLRDKGMAQSKTPTRRNWTKIFFYSSVIAILLVIISISCLLLLDETTQHDRNVNTLFQQGGNSSNGGDDFDGDGIFPGGFFSTNNEFCTGATRLTETGQTLQGATIRSSWDDTVDTCGDFMSIGRASWFAYQAEESRLMEASTCGVGTNFDTQITIASGSNCEELTCVTFDDQACGEQSRAVWFAEAGETYHINIHGYRDARGDFELTLQPVTSNDNCLVANGPLAIGSSVFGTTAGATLDINLEQCGDVNLSNHPGVWYVVEDAEGWVRAEAVTRHMGFIPQITVYSGFGCGTLECEGGSSTGSLKWRARTGVTYYVLVNGLNIEDGDFDLSISWEWQDTCDFAVPLSVNGAPFAATTSQARLHDVPICGESGFHSAPGMWFMVQGTGNLLTATTCGPASTLDSHISVFRNGCNALQCLGATGQDLPCGASGAISWASEVGQDYMIYVSGRGSRVGDFALTVSDSASQVGEVCQSAIALGSRRATTIYGSTMGTPEVATFCGDVVSARGVWYELEGSGNPLSLWTCDPATDFDARVSIFTGSCDGLVCATYTSASCSEISDGPLQFNTVAGIKYSLLVHGPTAEDFGSFALNLQEQEQNDSCTTAVTIASTTNTYFGSTVEASEGQVLSCTGVGLTPSAKAIWYTFVGEGSMVSFNTCSEDTEFDTEVSVYTGPCFNPECVETETDACGRQAVVSFQAVRDEVYRVRVAGADANEFGNYVLGVSVRSSFFGW